MRPVTALLSLIVTACGVSTEQGKQMDERMRRIEIAESANATRLVEVQQKLDELSATAHGSGADVAPSLDRVAESVRRLERMLEEQQRRQAELEASLAAMRSILAARSQGPRPAAIAPMPAVPAPRPIQARDHQAEFFAKAQEQDAAGKTVVATELYAEFVRKWPGDPRAPKAWFRIGEIAYGEKRFVDAMTAYGHVAEHFPKSDKAPDGLLRTAESMTALGMKDDAKTIYQAVGARYPRSAAAKKATARLGELYPSSEAKQ